MLLIERSPVAKKAGGPKKIRTFSKIQRQLVSAEIAGEIGKERAREKCAIMAVEGLMERWKYHKAAKAAKKYGLVELMKKAALKAYEKDMDNYRYYSAALTAKKYGFSELVEKPALEAVRELKKEGKIIKAMEAADTLGVDYKHAIRTTRI